RDGDNLMSHRGRSLSARAAISMDGIYSIVVCGDGRREDSGRFDPADSLARGQQWCRAGPVIIRRLAGFVIGHITPGQRATSKKPVAANEGDRQEALRATTITPSDIIVVGGDGRRVAGGDCRRIGGLHANTRHTDSRRIDGQRANRRPTTNPPNTIGIDGETRRTPSSPPPISHSTLWNFFC